jgi:hypothetical protein
MSNYSMIDMHTRQRYNDMVRTGLAEQRAQQIVAARGNVAPHALLIAWIGRRLIAIGAKLQRVAQPQVRSVGV